MRICYLLLVHHKFEQALRLMRRLAGRNSAFAIHIDAAADPRAAAAFRLALQPYEARFAVPVRASWGSYFQALAIMRVLQAAVEGPPADRYCLLSGQDYPLASLRDIEAFFARHPDSEFAENTSLDPTDAGAPGWSAFYRLRRYHVWTGGRRHTLPLLRKRMPPMPMFHGSTWWALTRSAVVHVVERFRSDECLRRYLRHGFLVDEMYLPSILGNSVYAGRITGSNLTYASWSPTSGPHPTVLTMADLPALLSSGKLFGRKFDDAVDARVLDELDRAAASEPAVAGS